MPDLTVAQNIFIGREPRRAGLIRDDELDAPGGRAASNASASRWTRGSRCRT